MRPRRPVPQSNSVIESMVQRVINGGKTLLAQAGLPGCFWRYAVQYACFARNITLVYFGHTPWEKRFGKAWNGPMIPFGAQVRFKPSAVGFQKSSKFLRDTVPGVFMGLHLLTGDVWKRDHLVVELADFVDVDLHDEALRSACHVRVQRVPEVRAEPQVFPLRKRYVWVNDTLEGLRARQPDYEQAPELEGLTGQSGLSREVLRSLAEAAEDDPTWDISDELDLPTRRRPLAAPAVIETDPQVEHTGADRTLVCALCMENGDAIPKGRDGVHSPIATTFTGAHGPRSSILDILTAPAIAKGHTPLPTDTGGEAVAAATRWSSCTAPPMEVDPPSQVVHRQKNPAFIFPVNACVARTVGKQEMLTHPKAIAAMESEWTRLRQQGDRGVWDESMVCEWSDVKAQAMKNGQTAHMGRIFELCFEKHPELPESNPLRKFKGRVVFQGNNVKDQSWKAAMFHEVALSCNYGGRQSS